MAKNKCTSSELTGAGARVVLRPLMVDEMAIKGLNSYQLPGMTREIITVDDFERDFAGQIAGGGSYSPLTFSGNMLVGDPSQNYLQVLLQKNTSFADLWVFVDKVRGDFWAMDLARNECGKIMVTEYSPQSAGKNDIVAVNVTAAVDGESGIFNLHTDELVFTVAADVLTATDGDFIKQGFKKGMTVIVETGDSITPYEYAIVDDVTATTLTFKTDTSLSVSSGTGKIHGMGKITEDE